MTQSWLNTCCFFFLMPPWDHKRHFLELWSRHKKMNLSEKAKNKNRYLDWHLISFHLHLYDYKLLLLCVFFWISDCLYNISMPVIDFTPLPLTDSFLFWRKQSLHGANQQPLRDSSVSSCCSELCEDRQKPVNTFTGFQPLLWLSHAVAVWIAQGFTPDDNAGHNAVSVFTNSICSFKGPVCSSVLDFILWFVYCEQWVFLLAAFFFKENQRNSSLNAGREHLNKHCEVTVDHCFNVWCGLQNKWSRCNQCNTHMYICIHSHACGWAKTGEAIWQWI